MKRRLGDERRRRSASSGSADQQPYRRTVARRRVLRGQIRQRVDHGDHSAAGHRDRAAPSCDRRRRRDRRAARGLEELRVSAGGAASSAASCSSAVSEPTDGCCPAPASRDLVDLGQVSPCSRPARRRAPHAARGTQLEMRASALDAVRTEIGLDRAPLAGEVGQEGVVVAIDRRRRTAWRRARRIDRIERPPSSVRRLRLGRDLSALRAIAGAPSSVEWMREQIGRRDASRSTRQQPLRVGEFVGARSHRRFRRPAARSARRRPARRAVAAAGPSGAEAKATSARRRPRDAEATSSPHSLRSATCSMRGLRPDRLRLARGASQMFSRRLTRLMPATASERSPPPRVSMSANLRIAARIAERGLPQRMKVRRTPLQQLSLASRNTENRRSRDERNSRPRRQRLAGAR